MTGLANHRNVTKLNLRNISDHIYFGKSFQQKFSSLVNACDPRQKGEIFMTTFLSKVKSQIKDELFLSPADLLRLKIFGSYAMIWRAVNTKELGSVRIGSSIRIPSEDVLSYLERNYHQAEKPVNVEV